MQLSQNQKKISQIFSAFVESRKKLQYFQKNVAPQSWFLFQIIDWKKRSYLNAQKVTVSENLWSVNILKGSKHCWNPHGSILVIFLDHSEKISAPKTLF